jgi:glycolate oxidase iron-sulfur subunit
VFEKEELDFIVMNSAGCGAFMKEYGQILSDDPIFHQRAKNISSKVKDLTEFLLFLGVKDKKTTQNHYYRNKRITYHDACHLAHTQKITQQPRELLRSFNSYEYIELPESNWCCGSAGIYNIVHYDASMKILERKIENILSIKPDVIVTANPGCMLQIEYGLAKRGFNIEIVHTATFLKKLILDISEE